MRTLTSALIVVLCLALSTPLYAANPLATDDTGTQGLMKFQAETSAEFGWDRDTGSGTTIRTRRQWLSATVTAGILDPLDLALTVPFSWQQVTDNGVKTYDQGGLNDVSLALKWRFLEIGPASLAIKPCVTFPSGDHGHGLGYARPAFGASLITTVEFKPVSLSANIGYSRQLYTDNDADSYREGLWNLSLAGSVELLKGLQIVAEVGTASNSGKSCTAWPTYMTGGVIYSVLENLDVSAGVKVGLTNPATDVSLLPGISYKFP